jgi:hypothetical protein
MEPEVPAELTPGDGDPVLAYGPFVVELDAGRRIGFRLAYEPQQQGPPALRWDEPDGGRVHYLGDLDWARAGPMLVSGLANGDSPALVRPVEQRDLAGTPYEDMGLAEALAQLAADNDWAWAEA